MENIGPDSSEMFLSTGISSHKQVSLTYLTSTIIHTETSSNYGVQVSGCCAIVTLIDTNMTFANLIMPRWAEPLCLGGRSHGAYSSRVVYLSVCLSVCRQDFSSLAES